MCSDTILNKVKFPKTCDKYIFIIQHDEQYSSIEAMDFS